MLAIFVSLLVLQPDIGQTVIVASVWCGLLFLSGYSLALLPVFAALGAAGLAAAYYSMPHFTARFDHFLGGSGETMQTSVASNAFRGGGLAGTRSRRGLPESAASRRPQRFCLRRDRRGDRHCRLPFLDLDLWLDRLESVEMRFPRGGYVHPPGGDGARHDFWIAGFGQYGGKLEFGSGKRGYSPFRLLWPVLFDRIGYDPRHDRCLDQTSGFQAGNAFHAGLRRLNNDFG